MKDKLLLIDAYSIICRGFYALPPLTNKDGLHTNAILGFLNILYKNIDEEKPKYIAVAFDENKPTFRHKLYKDYKGNRQKMPDELKEQVPYVKEILNASNIRIFSKEGFEADDILGSLANKFHSETIEVIILSGDKDMLQLATDDIKIKLVKTVKSDSNTYIYYANDVKKEYNLTPTQFIDLKALMGDKSDNIQGLKGIGQKIATELLLQYDSIENIYNHLDEIKKKNIKSAFDGHIDEAKFYKVLVTIKKDVSLDCNIEDLILKDIFNSQSFKVIEKLELKSQYRRFGKSSTIVSHIDNKELNKIEEIDNPFDDNDKYVNISVKENTIDNKKIINVFNQNVVFGNDKDLKSLYKEKSYISCFNYRKHFDNENLLFDNDIYLISITTKEKTFIFTENYSNEVLKLLDDKQIITKDLKNQLFYFDTDLSFDNKFLLTDNQKNNFDDISLMAYLVNPTQKDYEISTLAKQYLNIDIRTKKDYFNKKEEYEFCDLNKQPEKELVDYLSYSSKVIFLLYDILFVKLKELSLYDLYKNIELKLVYVLYNMQKYGIKIDKNKLEEYDKKLDITITQLTKSIIKLAGKDFNINSPLQLKEVLFTDLKLTYEMKKGEKLSTSIDVLEKLKNQHPIIEKIIEYRTVSKLSTTYAKGLSVFIKNDGRIHTNFNQIETATGRLSSDNPNLQNIPIRTELGRKLREVFITSNDRIFIDADYSQIELRLLAIISNDEKLIKAYSLGNDVHTITASEVFGVSIDKVTADLRRRAKAVNFGIIYGMSSYGLSDDLHIDTKEARDYINKYFDTYKQVKVYLDETVDKAKQLGYTKTLFGRIRPINEFKSSIPNIRAFAKRVAMNSPIQGSASDIIKNAMVLIDNEFEKQKLKSRIVLQVHDEILIETQKNEIDRVKEILYRYMRDEYKYKVVLDINISLGNSFGEVH